MKRNLFPKRIIIFLLLFTFVINLFAPVMARADEPEHKVVRVGWFDSSFC